MDRRCKSPGLAQIRALVEMASDGRDSPTLEQIEREMEEYTAQTIPTGGWYSINAAGFWMTNCAISKNIPLLNSVPGRCREQDVGSEHM